jgi:hypothetical protein
MMIFDHIGSNFLQDQETLRQIGRAAAPIFFFFIGFSNSKRTDYSLPLLGAAIVIIDFILFGKYSANILISLFIFRLFNRIFEDEDFNIKASAIFAVAFLTFLTFPSMHIFEYSTIGVLPYLLGHLIRLNRPNKNFFILALGGLYYISLFILSGMMDDKLFLSSYIITTFILMGTISDKTYSAKPGIVDKSIYLLGKYALQIYFVHVIIFKLIQFNIS